MGFIVSAELHSSSVKELIHNFLIVQFSCVLNSSSDFSKIHLVKEGVEVTAFSHGDFEAFLFYHIEF